MLNRRDLLAAAATTGTASALTGSVQAGQRRSTDLIDTNVSLFQWPFRRLPYDDPVTLSKKLQSLGIVEAWAASFEGVLHRDLSSANSRLADACREHEVFAPVGVINVALPDWEEDLERCLKKHRMHALRVYPNYHGYDLKSPAFEKLVRLITRRAVLQIAASMEDQRTQHPLVRVADVDLDPIIDLCRRIDGSTIQILNYRPRSSFLQQAAQVPGLYFDTARVDSTDGVPQLVQALPEGRVLFGSHAPFLTPEAAIIRTHESNKLAAATLKTIWMSNARNLRRGVTK